MTQKSFSSIFTWLKEHFSWVVIAALLVLFGMYSWQQAAKLDILARQSEEEFARHTTNLAEMRALYESDRVAQEEINRRYSEEILRLTETYNARLAQLESRVTARRQRFIEETSGQPTEMADRVRERLGWQ